MAQQQNVASNFRPMLNYIYNNLLGTLKFLIISQIMLGNNFEKIANRAD